MNKQPQTPGQMLAAARDAKPLSQADIAKQMCLSVETVNDLERDEYTKIGARTFVRGYLSMYSRLVGVSQIQVLELFDSLTAMTETVVSVGHPIVEGAPVLDVTRDRSRMRYSPKALAGFSGLLLIIFFVAWHSSKSSETPVTPMSKSEPVAVMTPASTVPTPIAILPAVAPVVTPVAAAVTPAVVGAATNAASAPAASPEVKPVVAKKKRVWHTNPNWSEKPSKNSAAPLKATYTITPVKPE